MPSKNAVRSSHRPGHFIWAAFAFGEKFPGVERIFELVADRVRHAVQLVAHAGSQNKVRSQEWISYLEKEVQLREPNAEARIGARRERLKKTCWHSGCREGRSAENRLRYDAVHIGGIARSTIQKR